MGITLWEKKVSLRTAILQSIFMSMLWLMFTSVAVMNFVRVIYTSKPIIFISYEAELVTGGICILLAVSYSYRYTRMTYKVYRSWYASRS